MGFGTLECKARGTSGTELKLFATRGQGETSQRAILKLCASSAPADMP
jgi:hypothetical protein